MIRILIILTIILFISCDEIPSEKQIYGVWKGDFQGKEIMFKFESNSTCILSFTNLSSSSVLLLNGNYEMDFSKKPITLSVRNIPNLSHPLHTIVDFVDINSIKLANFAPRWRVRPISFDHSKSINLKRSK